MDIRELDRKGEPIRIQVPLVIEMTDKQYADEYRLPAQGGRLYARAFAEKEN